MTEEPLHILLIEDDEDDAVLAREMLRDSYGNDFSLRWCRSEAEAFEAIAAERYDVILLDYHVGARTGREILEHLMAANVDSPIIILTGQDDPAVDKEMTKAGAADFLIKSELAPRMLERSIRYAREQHRMILALKQSEERLADALRRSESRYRKLADSNMIGMIVTRTDGTIIEANDAFLSMIDRTRAELETTGINWRDVTPVDHIRRSVEAVEEVKRYGACRPFEKEYLRPDGERVPALIGAALLDGSDEMMTFVVDLTRQKEYERALDEARARAEAANRAKDDFLAVLSHELRTPLTPIMSISSLLAEDPALGEEMNSYMEIIYRNVRLEARLIDDLLDMSRVLRGKLLLDTTLVRLNDLVRSAISICEEDFRTKRLSVEIDLDGENDEANGDPARLQQVFWNLLKNAAKFTPEEGAIHVRSREVAGGMWELRVSDTGIGIAHDVIERLFEPFEQGSADAPKKMGGLGLGLSISRGLIELHGGTIAAESDGPGRGATFTVLLPLAAGALSGLEGEEREGTNWT